MSIRTIVLSGFLGAGKTTTARQLAQRLEARGERVAVVVNDHGRQLVDTRALRSAAVRVEEVTGGCLCRRFDDLTEIVGALVRARAATTVVIEAVGSCADLRSTVVRPLRRRYGDGLRVAPIVAVVDPSRYLEPGSTPDGELSYLVDRQLADADVIAVNKVDTLTAKAVSTVRTQLADRYPHASIATCSARTGVGVADLEAQLVRGHADRDVETDRRRCTAAQARVAWLDVSVEVGAVGSGGVFAVTWVTALLDSLADQCRSGGDTIGHVKVWMASPVGEVSASLVGRGDPTVTHGVSGRAPRMTALVNARVATCPERLNGMVAAAVAVADRAAATRTRWTGAPDAFVPGPSTPVHRTAARAGSQNQELA